MAMNFDIPDITENGEKAAAGGQRRKPRRIGALRLGDTLRAVSRHYTATLENKDEDKEAEFYSLSEGEEKASFYGMDVSVTGICIRKMPRASASCFVIPLFVSVITAVFIGMILLVFIY